MLLAFIKSFFLKNFLPGYATHRRVKLCFIRMQSIRVSEADKFFIEAFYKLLGFKGVACKKSFLSAGLLSPIRV
jgi:hypothetical protein